jgi:hypothetical protein
MTQDSDYLDLTPLSAEDPKVKGVEGKRIRVRRSIYNLGSIRDLHFGVGTRVGGGGGGGGGVVTSVSGSSFTVEFPGGTVPRYIELPGVETTVIHEYIVAAPEGSGSGFGIGIGGFGPFIGQEIGGGGVVTSFTDATVTISFPHGVPDGPIELPWVKTTVVEEHTPDVRPGATLPDGPFGSSGEVASSSLGIEMEGVTIGTEVGGLRTRYELPKPGSLANSVRIQPRLLEEPRNDSTCPCAVYIASWDAAGTKLDLVELVPGQTIPEYRPPPGAAVTRFGCAAGCTGDCLCAISVLSPLVG